ncbi:MAG: class I SAM-dependent rRNA methyltransferase [Methylotetracoccus sp.]|jgi:23S rRNA (cytosine1962-C5)-methyltransferase|nr:class I SAM-dependent rRNA methyltransferase [Methylotetracoccus sp.]
MNALPPLRLRKNEERRIRTGHLWVFSNEVDVDATPLRNYAAGDLVQVEDHRQAPLGIAYVNPESLICARILTRDIKVEIGESFLSRRLTRALHLRELLFDRPFYRLVYGESDGLPGVVIDRFGDVLVAQANTAGAERLLEHIVSILEKVLLPRAIVLKNVSSARELEGLDCYVRVVRGAVEGLTRIIENDVPFWVDPVHGQKTGWFYDHRHNRHMAAKLAKCQRVLDLFSYTGAWGVQAAVAGAEQVDCVDGSAAAIDLARENARLNTVNDRMRFIQADVFEFLKHAREDRRRYDLIVLDPPALIKRKKDIKAGTEAYRRLNQLVLQALNPGGVLISASCSYHLQRAVLHDILRSLGRHLDRHLIFFWQTGQGPDHPVHPGIAETEYLKAVFCHVTAPM